MGVARYVRLADEPTVAEAAVTVVDRYQGRGLGTALLKLIVGSALANGITTLRNYVLASNTAMLDIFNELGATRIPEGGGVYRIDLPLTPVVETSAPAEMLRQAALAPAAAEDAPSVGFTALRHWWERRDDADA
jgi:GNAT superfamily N-acetyltransferase